MRIFRTALIGAGAIVALAGVAGTAAAQSTDSQVIKVRLPGGGIGEIYYTGNVPPRIVIESGPAVLAAFDPMPALFGPDSSFAAMERISAEMGRQAAAMFAQAQTLATRARSGSPQVVETALGNLPPSTAGYSYISTMSSNGVCTRSVEITSTGNGAQPKVVSHSSGNCGSDAGVSAGASGSVSLPVSRPPVDNGPDLILTKTHQPKIYTTAVRKVADTQR